MGYSAEKYPWMSILLGLALVFVWGVISLAHAYDRSLTRMNDSFTQSFMIADRLGGILDALSRLSVDQQAFLSTGDARFQDGVIESGEALTIDIGMLNSLAAKAELQRPPIASLSRSVDQVLNLVGESDGVRQRRGASAALAYFDSREIAIAEAKLQAGQLRSEIGRRISDRVRDARSPRVLLQDVLGGTPAGIAVEHRARGIRVSTQVGIE
jgi:hypothetical protein